ncbi:MAG: biotin synthase BioB [Desulfotalea sp.]|nr:MAG: biotin synthase BioB [Desulfotalea sp.]
MNTIEKCLEKILNGEDLSFTEAQELALQSAPEDLYKGADNLRARLHNNRLDLCSIVNAKSGICTEDCRFCAQSMHYDAEVTNYEQVNTAHAVLLAKDNEKYGVRRFSLVTAGRSVSEKQLGELQKIYQELQKHTKLSLCASMGFLTAQKALQLKEMGVSRYHCNLETSRSYFPQICTSHSWEDKSTTIKIAQNAGLEVCSGGIIGMGESFEQRLELAFELKKLNILSVPINILSPINNTPFADLKPLSTTEILTTVAMFRFILPKAVIRIAGGRDILGDQQHRLFTSGANGSIVGNYLTTLGKGLEADVKMFQMLGFEIQGHNHISKAAPLAPPQGEQCR